MQQPKHGKRLCLALALLLLSSCRDSQPPVISIICLGDGFGGADCSDPQGNKSHKTPADLSGYWMTTETDEANFASWCYATDMALIQLHMEKTKERIR